MDILNIRIKWEVSFFTSLLSVTPAFDLIFQIIRQPARYRWVVRPSDNRVTVYSCCIAID